MVNTSKYYGVYRGVVEDIKDPDERKRYRVRVVPVYPDTIPVDHLPWAEACFFGGKGFGDLPHWDVGDLVWCAFEGGDRRLPVIVGGWLSQYTGTTDIPMEVVADYETTQVRWIRYDRDGNKILMSPLAEESGIYIESGENKIEVRQKDDTILIKSNQRIMVEAPTVELETTTLNANVEGNMMAFVQQEATIRGTDRVSLQSANNVFIGRYEDPVSGALLPNTTPEVSIQATSGVEVIASDTPDSPSTGTTGTIDVDASQDITVDTPTNIVVTGDQSVNLTSSALVQVDAPTVQVNATGTEGVINLQSTTTINANADTSVNVTAGSDVVVFAEDNARLTAKDITIVGSGDISMTGGGDMTVRQQGTGATKLTVEGTVVDLSSTAGPMTIKTPPGARLDISSGQVDLTGSGDLRMAFDGSITAFSRAGMEFSTLGSMTFSASEFINIG
jgi:uncharacterized protein (DUF2345 family)